VYALDASTGALKWNYTTGGGVDSSPAVSGGFVYVGSWDGKVYGTASINVGFFALPASFVVEEI
jgi:outer membrane protein assembly factor BamB